VGLDFFAVMAARTDEAPAEASAPAAEEAMPKAKEPPPDLPETGLSVDDLPVVLAAPFPPPAPAPAPSMGLSAALTETPLANTVSVSSGPAPASDAAGTWVTALPQPSAPAEAGAASPSSTGPAAGTIGPAPPPPATRAAEEVAPVADPRGTFAPSPTLGDATAVLADPSALQETVAAELEVAGPPTPAQSAHAAAPAPALVPGVPSGPFTPSFGPPPAAGSSALATVIRLPGNLASDLAAVVTQGADGVVELHLSPEELGRVHLSLQPDGDRIHLLIQVERPETLDLLRRNSETLLQEMRQAGFQGANLSFSGWSGEGRTPGGTPARAGLPANLADPAPSPRFPSIERAAASALPGTLDLRL
jgi:flagellar hook-length control protein FliK